MKKPLLIVLVLLGSVAASCPPRGRPQASRFVLMPAGGPAPMAVQTSCSDDLACDTVAGNSTCTVSQGCVNGECKFAVAAGPSCPCYEGDIRWCGSGTSSVQFCAEKTPGVTAWQSQCGPTQVECATSYPGNAECALGTVATVFNVANAQWIAKPGETCEPTKTCPADGFARTCTPSSSTCSSGTQVYGRATGWGPCVPACPACVPSGEVCDGRDNDCNGTVDDGMAVTACRAPAAGACAAGHTTCVNGRVECVAGTAQPEVCDGVDNDCDGLADPVGVCGEVVVRHQSDSDNGAEMTWSPGLPTDLIDGYRDHGGSCGEDDHGRPYYRTRAEVSAWAGNGASCELAGPYGGYISSSKTDCRIRVHYKTTRMGSNVWCSGTWWAAPQGAYRR